MSLTLPALDLTKVRKVPPGARTGRIKTQSSVQYRMLTPRDMRLVNEFVGFNSHLQHGHRSGAFADILPMCPIEKKGDVVDTEVQMKIAVVAQLESPLDLPLRFVPPADIHSVPIKDPATRSSLITKLFSTIKGSAGLPVRQEVPKNLIPSHTDKRPVPVLMKDYEMKALAGKRSGNRSAEAHALLNYAIFAYNALLYEPCVESLQRCAGLFEHLGNRQGVAFCYDLLGVAYFWMEEFKMSLHFFQKLESLCGSYGKAVAQCNMGVCYSALGEKDYAVYAFQDAIYNARDGGDDGLMTIIEGNLGLAEYRTGNAKAAQDHLERCLEGCALAGDNVGAAITMQILGDAYMHVKDYEHAEFYYSNALRVGMQAGVPDVVQLSRICLGVVKGAACHEERLLAATAGMGAVLSIGDVLKLDQ